MGKDAGLFREAFALVLFVALCGKKRPQHLPRLIRANPCINLWPVMHGRLVEQPWPMFDRTAFWVARAIIKPGNAGMGDGACTHGAGLQRDPKVATSKAVGAKCSGGFAQRDNFGMGGGIVRSERAVGAAADNDAVLDDQRTDRNFTSLCRRAGERQGFLHEAASRLQWHYLPTNDAGAGSIVANLPA